MAIQEVSVPVLTSSYEETLQNTGLTNSPMAPFAALKTSQWQTVAPVAQQTVALSGPPANLTAGSATALAFANPNSLPFAVNRVVLQNKSTVNVYVELDGSTTATLGSWVVYPQTMASFDVPLTNLSVYCASALALNGSADGNLKLGGWL